MARDVRDLISTAASSAYDRLAGAYLGFTNPRRVVRGRSSGGEDVVIYSVRIPPDPYHRYRLLDLYKKNAVYRDVKRVLTGVESPVDMGAIRALENPALQAVQFGVMHIFPGPLAEAMPLTAGAGAPAGLLAGAERVLQASNMAAQKDSITEDVYTYGDDFLKAVPKPDNSDVYVDAKHPGDVVAFREDNRRNMRYIRLDWPIDPDENGGATMWTEVWDREENRYASWKHKQHRGARLDTLGTAFEGPRKITDFGHDYVPFVRVPFEGGARPNRLCPGVFELHIEGIDQLNRNATDLDDLYKRNAEGAWLVMRNQQGLSAPEMIDEEIDDEEDGEPEEHVAHGRKIVRMAGVASVSDLVASIDYRAGLMKLEDRRKALERSMAELRYFRGIEGGDPAAAAMAQDRAPAIARAVAARGNIEEGVLRVTKMCLSMGQKRGIFGADVGDFKAGDFDKLGFAPRAIVPETPEQKAERLKKRADTWRAHADMGLLEWYLTGEEGMDSAQAKTLADAFKNNSRSQRAASLINGGA